VRIFSPKIAILALFAAASLFGPSALAKSRCENLSQGLIEGIQDFIHGREPGDRQFWENSSEVLVSSATGKSAPLTFSFDSEVSLGDAFRTISKDQRALGSVEQLLSRPSRNSDLWRNNEAWSRYLAGLHHTKPELLELLKMSEKRFDSFALRRGVSRDKTTYSPTDLNAVYFQEVIDASHQDKDDASFKNYARFIEIFGEIFKSSLKRKDYPVNVHRDKRSPEISHVSWEFFPRRFKEIVNRLHQDIRFPQTHLHLGIPAEQVSASKAIEIARAVESRIILSLAENWTAKDKTPLAYTEYSSLRNRPAATTERGLVRFDPDEWTKPVLSHNLEIRNWLDIEDGMDNLALAATLAINHRHIVENPDFTAAKITDPLTSNLNGALKYVGSVLKDSSNAENRSVGEALAAFGNEIEKKGEITPEIRKRVAEFLEEHEVLGRLTASAFLREKAR
jgi:hypothetical protein